jgi:acyl-[acyl-carrier-protein]-phospholipid O-acyltransferase/long-chain-fatty-acid--[acyl-carrier-protein] ligase
MSRKYQGMKTLTDQTKASSNSTSERPSNLRDRGSIANRGFLSLLAISFFGAANDNILKQILILMVAGGGLWANRLGEGSQGVVGLVLTLPFIFLSGYAGQLADKFSKQQVILWVKIAEIPIALLAFAGLIFGSFWLSLLALLLLAVQSSFYGPAKFGSIPDLVDDHRLSQANGFINALSNVAVILGSLAAGPLADMYYPMIKASELETPRAIVAAETTSDGDQALSGEEVEGEGSAEGVKKEDQLVRDPNRPEVRWPAGAALLLVAFAGLGAVLFMPKMKAVAPNLKLSKDIFGSHFRTFKDSNRPLLVVLFSWSGFYMIGMLALLLLPDYREILLVSNTSITVTVGLLAIAIVIGSILVAVLSGKTIRPYLALIGAFGMTACFATMGFVSKDFLGLEIGGTDAAGLKILVFLIGFFAGFYIVPLQSLLQFLSPSDERGRFFGTANFLSFVFTSAASLLYWGLKGWLNVPTERIPLVCAALALTGTLVGTFELNRIMAAQKSLRIDQDDAQGKTG